MIPHITELIYEQIKTIVVMFGAGVVIESLWLAKKYGQEKSVRINIIGKFKSEWLIEMMFWILAAGIYSMFLYYCSYGVITFHGIVGFLIGLLLWKKICCGILKIVWVEKEEVENLKTTAKLSTSKRLENRDWKKGKLRRKKKKNV